MIKAKIIIILILALFAGCEMPPEEKLRLAREEFDRKIQRLELERAEICLNEALAIAEAQADSLVQSLQKNPLGDSLYRPEIPTRPEFVPTDSNIVNSKRSVKPIIQY